MTLKGADTTYAVGEITGDAWASPPLERMCRVGGVVNIVSAVQAQDQNCTLRNGRRAMRRPIGSKALGNETSVM